MIKVVVAGIIIVVFVVTGCGAKMPNGTKGATEIARTINTGIERAEGVVDDITSEYGENGLIVSEAVKSISSNFDVEKILKVAQAIGVGNIKGATIGYIDGKTVLDIVAEDGTNYRYL